MKALEQEQADYILAEFRKELSMDDCVIRATLNKCVNAVPVNFQIRRDNESLTLGVASKKGPYAVFLQILHNDEIEESGVILLTLHELKEHIEHCQRMLTHLEA